MKQQEKKTITKLFPYEYTDLEALREYLEEMEAKGWRLTSLRNMPRFEECTPGACRYNVEILPTAGYGSNEVTDGTREYLDLCRDAGWEYVCHNSNVYVFRAAKQDAVPVVTDDGEKVTEVRRSFTKTLIMMAALFLLTVGNAVISFFAQAFLWETPFSLPEYFRDPSAFRGVSLSLLVALLAVMLGGLLLSRAVLLFRWHRRAVNALRAGEPVPFFGLEVLRRRRVLYVVLLGLIFVLMVLTAFVGAVLERYYVVPITVALALLFVVIALFIGFLVNRKNYSFRRNILIGVLTGVLIALVAGVCGFLTAFFLPELVGGEGTAKAAAALCALRF